MPPIDRDRLPGEGILRGVASGRAPSEVGVVPLSLVVPVITAEIAIPKIIMNVTTNVDICDDGE